MSTRTFSIKQPNKTYIIIIKSATPNCKKWSAWIRAIHASNIDANLERRKYAAGVTIHDNWSSDRPGNASIWHISWFWAIFGDI